MQPEDSALQNQVNEILDTQAVTPVAQTTVTPLEAIHIVEGGDPEVVTEPPRVFKLTTSKGMIVALTVVTFIGVGITKLNTSPDSSESYESCISTPGSTVVHQDPAYCVTPEGITYLSPSAELVFGNQTSQVEPPEDQPLYPTVNPH